MSGDLGFPKKMQAGALPTDKERAYKEYTLPVEATGLGWGHSDFSGEDLTFRMIELNSREQDRCAKHAGGNQSRLTRELIFAALWTIGDWKVKGNRDKLEAWYEAIGGGGKRLVEAAFVDLNSVKEEAVDSFLASGRTGFGS